MNPHILNHDFWSSHWDTTCSIGQSKITDILTRWLRFSRQAQFFMQLSYQWAKKLVDA